MARRLRARALPLPLGDPSGISHDGGACDEGLSAEASWPDEDAAIQGLVGHPSSTRVRGTGLQEGREAGRNTRVIDIAVIGAGRWGPHLIRNFDNHQASRVSWVIDRDPS